MKTRPPRTEYLEFLAAYQPLITELSLATRALVLEEAPDAIEMLYDAYNAVAAGYSFTERPSDCFIHIASYAKWVNLGFNYGAALPDPARLLKGKGSRVRSTRIAEIATLKQPAIRNLIRAAILNAVRPSKPAGSKTVVRAIYAQRRRPERTK